VADGDEIPPLERPANNMPGPLRPLARPVPAAPLRTRQGCNATGDVACNVAFVVKIRRHTPPAREHGSRWAFLMTGYRPHVLSSARADLLERRSIGWRGLGGARDRIREQYR